MTTINELRDELHCWCNENKVSQEDYEFWDKGEGVFLKWNSVVPEPSVEVLMKMDKDMITKSMKKFNFQVCQVEMVDDLDEIPDKALINGSLVIVKGELKFWNGTEWK